MADLRKENGTLVVEERGQAAAFGNVVLLIVGTCMTLAGIVKLSYSEWVLAEPFLYGVVFLIFGLICLLGLIGRSSTDERYSLTIEDDSVLFTREGRTVKFARQDFTAVELQRDPSGRAKTPTYALYLRRADGSYFWLFSATVIKTFEPWFAALTAALGCPGVNATGIEFPELAGVAMAGPPPAASSEPVEFETSRWVKIGRGATGELLVLERPVNWIARTILSLTAVLFLGIPSVFLFMFFTGSDSVPMAGVPFFAVFLSVAVMIFILIMKRFEVELRSDQVRAKISLGPALFARLLPQVFTRERIIPRESISHVRVDRVVGGNYRFVLVLKNTIGSRPVSLVDRIFFRTGVYPAPHRVPADPGDTIELWELEGWNKIAKGPVLEDLLFLEKTMQDRLRVDESGGAALP